MGCPVWQPHLGDAGEFRRGTWLRWLTWLQTGTVVTASQANRPGGLATTPLTHPRPRRGEGFEPPTARSVAWCSASIWSAPDRSGLLTLQGSSVRTDPEGSRRIVWMINRMINHRELDDPGDDH